MSTILTVSQMNRYLSFRFKEDANLRGKLIRGEISNFTHHLKSGHFYFSLRDQDSAIRAVMFRSQAETLDFLPSNGMEVVVSASVQVFERDGTYQLYVSDMVPAGAGAVRLSVERLRERLAAEGLFDLSNKKPIPRFPKRVGILTAKTGAALQDILSILERRYPCVTAELFPVLVQGPKAADSIRRALGEAQASRCDVLIVGRGGGSLEDLAPFDTEEVARAVASSRIPVISAVGHETNITLCDSAADLRAATPSAAAELAVPDQRFLADQLLKYREMLYNKMTSLLKDREKRLELSSVRLASRSVAGRLALAEDQLTRTQERLRFLMLQRIARQLTKIEEMSREMRLLTERNVAQKRHMLDSRAAALEQLDPLRVLGRGYALVRRASDGKLLKNAKDAVSGEILQIRLAGGTLEVQVTNHAETAENSEIKS